MYNQCTIGSTGIILQKLMLQVSDADGRQYSNAENTHVSHLYHAKHLCPKQSQLSPMVDDEPSLRACEPLAAVCWNAFVLEQNCRQAQEAAKEEQLLNGEKLCGNMCTFMYYIYHMARMRGTRAEQWAGHQIPNHDEPDPNNKNLPTSLIQGCMCLNISHSKTRSYETISYIIYIYIYVYHHIYSIYMYSIYI